MGLGATLTIDIDPTIELGPLVLAWHGTMIAVGVGAGGWLAARYAAERGLDRDQLFALVLLIAGAGLVGARVLFLAQNDAAALLRPGEWLGSQGFSFYGAMVFGATAVAVYVRRAGLSLRYLDALAAGFPLGMAVGRVGDLILGEHYGPASNLPWAIRYPHPDAEVPSHDLAYHPGGLYEIVLALVILAVIWPLRDRFRRPTMLLWAVVSMYAVGRFLMFFYRNDTESASLGLNVAQLESVALLGLAALGAWWARGAERRRSALWKRGAASP